MSVWPLSVCWLPRCCCCAGTGPDGLQELESREGCGVSLSLVHLPPGVRLLVYHRAKGAESLQLGANAYSGEPHHEDVFHVQDLMDPTP